MSFRKCILPYQVAVLLLMTCGWPAYGQERVSPVVHEPPNLGLIKRQLIHYHGCSEDDCYFPQLERQVSLAITFLNQSVEARLAGEKLAIVLDIDETALSNWAVESHDDFAYIAADLNWCVSLHCGKGIPGTLKLFKFAKQNGVAVFFITGRPEGQRADTEENLKEAGYDFWEGLYMRPENHPKTQSVTEYKSGNRSDIVAKGYRIIVNVGDQMSDLEGNPQAEHSVKLPNQIGRA